MDICSRKRAPASGRKGEVVVHARWSDASPQDASHARQSTRHAPSHTLHYTCYDAATATLRPTLCHVARAPCSRDRWFETTGCFLTYYKSKRMTRLLAALNLPQVGKIALVKKEEAEADDVADVGCLFSITLGDRDYLLKATDPESAQKWVDTLSQLKEGANSAATPEATNPVGPTPDPEPAAASGAWEKKGRRGALFGCC